MTAPSHEPTPSALADPLAGADAAPPATSHVFVAPHAGRRRLPSEDLEDLARIARGNGDEWDTYGDNGLVAELERRVAELLGKPAAALFPSGIMAQQCALRVWTDGMKNKRVALPDLSHLLVHEEGGPALLHGFSFEPLTVGAKTVDGETLASIPGELGAVLVELPLRDGGYLLPTWDELTAFAASCDERGIPLHLDGARLWESTSWFGRSLAEVAAVADSVYVSLYKGLGGPSGAVLAGEQEFVDEARLWRRRMGGTVFSLVAEAAAGLRGLDEELPGMGARHQWAIECAALLNEAGLRTFPEVPHTNAFRCFVPLDLDEANGRLVAHQAITGQLVLRGLRRADVPGWCWTELTVDRRVMERTPAEGANAVVEALRLG